MLSTRPAPAWVELLEVETSIPTVRPGVFRSAWTIIKLLGAVVAVYAAIALLFLL